MNHRLGKALFVAGLTLGLASWIVERTWNEDLAEKKRLYKAIEASAPDTDLVLSEVLYLVRVATIRERLRALDQPLDRHRVEPARYQAERELLLKGLGDAEAARSEAAKRAAYRSFTVLAPFAPEAARQLEQAYTREVAAIEQFMREHDEAHARGDEGDRFLLMPEAVLRAAREARTSAEALVARAEAETKGLEERAARASMIFKGLYVLSALLVIVGEILKP